MSVFRTNAKLVGNIPINFFTPTGALAGETSIDIVSETAIPLVANQEFYLIQDDLTVLVKLTAPINLVSGLNTLEIEPLLLNVPPLAATEDRIGKHGNPIPQTVKAEFLAKLNYVSSTGQIERDLPAAGGSDSREVKVRGRLHRPKFMPPYFQEIRFYMLWQTSRNLCTEGEFVADPSPVSAIRAEEIFGDKLYGTFITNNPAHTIAGDINAICC